MAHIGSDSQLVCHEPNGTEKWKYRASALIWSTPAIAEDGTIYFGTWGSIPYFNAVTPNGKQKWLFAAGAASYSPAIAPDGTIYVGTENISGKGPVYALTPNGTQKWVYITGYTVMGCPAIGNDGTIYIGSGDYYLYALYPNGTLRWKFLTGSYIKGSASIAPDGTIYVPSFDDYLYALNPDGTLRWRASTGTSIAGAGVALGADGTIYIGTEQLRAFYPNGTLKWCTNVQGSVYATVPAVSADGTIYVDADGALVAVNPDGTVKWRSTISNEQCHSSPCIGPNDRIYVGSIYQDYGYLHAFGPGEPKKIKILQPQPGDLYILDNNHGRTLFNRTVIIGAVTIKVNVYSPDDIINVSFYIDDVHGTVTSPPFEWKMNQRYGNKPLMKGSITVVGYYKGGPSWTESMSVVYFHLF